VAIVTGGEEAEELVGCVIVSGLKTNCKSNASGCPELCFKYKFLECSASQLLRKWITAQYPRTSLCNKQIPTFALDAKMFARSSTVVFEDKFVANKIGVNFSVESFTSPIT